MKYLIPSVALACALTAPAAAALAQPATVPALGSNDCSSVALAENTESVQVGAVAIGNVSLTGPSSCVGSVTTDNANARVTLEKENNAAFVHIIALHEGYTNVLVRGADGSQIGTIKVAIYPRDPLGSL